MQIISNDETVRIVTVQDLGEVIAQALATQTKKRRTVNFDDAFF